MSTYKALTAYLQTLEDDSFGKWIIDKNSKGTADSPKQMPYAAYSRTVDHLIDDIHTFVDTHREYGLNRYHDTLADNGIKWDLESMKEADPSTLDGKCIMALLVGAVRGERFCEGAVLNLLQAGAITKWLKRLQQIDES